MLTKSSLAKCSLPLYFFFSLNISFNFWNWRTSLRLGYNLLKINSEIHHANRTDIWNNFGEACKLLNQITNEKSLAWVVTLLLEFQRGRKKHNLLPTNISSAKVFVNLFFCLDIYFNFWNWRTCVDFGTNPLKWNSESQCAWRIGLKADRWANTVFCSVVEHKSKKGHGCCIWIMKLSNVEDKVNVV